MSAQEEPPVHVREARWENYLVDRTTLEGPKSDQTHSSDIGVNTVKEPFRMDRTVVPLMQVGRER